MGEEDARKWRCPFVCGGREPREPAPEAVEPLQEVAATIHATGLTTCPNWYASQPAARTVLRARKWAERGLLRERFGKPSLALMEAIDEVDEALDARERDDDERREEERKKERSRG